MTKLTIQDVAKNLDQWPRSWEIDDGDAEIGRRLLDAVFLPFFEHLAAQGLAKKTIRRHIDNIWLLGGEIIEELYEDEEEGEELRTLAPSELVLHLIDSEGGPYSKHLNSEAEMRSFDSSCKKLFKFLRHGAVE